MMGPRTTAEHLDCALDDARQEIDTLKERNDKLQGRLIDLLGELRRMAEIIDGQIEEINGYLNKGNK